MKDAFKKAARYYTWLILLFIPAFWTYIVIDDWVFIEKYWPDHWARYIWSWFIWFLVYLLALSFYFWLPVALIIVVYHRWIKAS